MRLEVQKDHVLLQGTEKELKAVKKLPIGIKYPKKPRVIQNVVERLKLNAEVTLPPLRPFPEWFSYRTEPLPHQDEALRLLWTFKGTNLLLDPGLGKTKILLDFLHLRNYDKVIVVCPSPLISVWMDERIKHRPELKLHPILAVSDELPKKGILLLSYAMSRLRHTEILYWTPQCIILDEALIQNKSTTALNMIMLGKLAEERILASGSLVNNGPLNLYYPLHFSEPSLVGGSFTKFADYFTDPKLKKKILERTSYGNTPDPEHLDELKSIVQATSIIMRKEAVMEHLPKPITEIVPVEMPPEYEELERNIRSNWVLEIPGHTPVFLENPLEVHSRIAQLSAGFFYIEEDGRKLPWFLDEQPKIDRFIAHACESSDRGIVWFRYRAQGIALQERLDREGIPYLFVDGSTKNVSQVVQEFNSNPKFKYLLAQERVLNYGQTIMGSEESIFPGMTSTVVEQHFITESYSYQVTTQQEGRNHRIGLTFQPRYYKYLMTDLDCLVRETLESRRDVSEKILEQFVLKVPRST